jgi:UPF0716 protein FxsA
MISVCRVILALLLIVFIVVPIFELWLILQVAEALGGGATGAMLTIALLIADSLLGAWLLQSQGRSVWTELKASLNAGKLPAREVINGGFVIVGGVLLITPGFLSDILGFMMLLPPTRKVFGNWVFAFVSRRVRLATGFADTGVRDFPRSSQSRRPADQSGGAAARARRGPTGDQTDSVIEADEDPAFDFETRR